ncbi:hypothetical protein [uncultured Shimia sp.]|uniref:hypothetical protein n=1 Tax=uncultured Shimia sp. TaxID=573152 RepID=UPI00262E1230|nr:hypothetical protein [uncultured Shimia sp.]
MEPAFLKGLKLAKKADKRFNEDLRKPRFNKPIDARQLLPQMLEKSKLGETEFVECGLEADAIYERIANSIPRDSFFRKEHFDALRDLCLPILAEMCRDRRLKAALEVPLTKEQLAQLRKLVSQGEEQQATLQEILERVGSLENAVADSHTLSLDEHKALTKLFGSRNIETKEEIVSFLTVKARQFSSLKSELDDLKGASERIGNIHSAALAKLRQLDLEAAEALISNAKDVKRENVLAPAILQNAQLLLTEARIALF